MNIRECIIITTNIVLILKKRSDLAKNKIGKLIRYMIFRGNGKATIMFVYLEEGQNRNRLAWLDIGDDLDLVVDLENPVDGDDPENPVDPEDPVDPVDHDGRGDDRVQEVDADDQDPVVKSGGK